MGKIAQMRKKDKRKIFKTTDGYFTDRADIKKPRRVAAIDQRRDDGALAVTKIYSKKDKSGKRYIDKLVLKPKDHSSLTEDSLVGNNVLIAVKVKTPDGQEEYKPIFKGELEETGDKLKIKEYVEVKRKISNDTPQHRKTYKAKMKKWHKHFKDK